MGIGEAGARLEVKAIEGDAVPSMPEPGAMAAPESTTRVRSATGK
jgi:hypothetical protein